MKKGVVGVLSLLTGAAAGAVAGAVSVGRNAGGKIDDIQRLSDKHLALYLMMNQWVKVKQDGKNLSAYFEKNGYKRIAVYGMNYVGETLLEELKETATEVVYAIDKKADSIYTDLSIYTPDEDLEQVDAVVVTAITFFGEIEEALSVKVDCPIISLEDILYEV